MIVFTGDWVKISGMWKQVFTIDFDKDLFCVLDSDGAVQWWGTENQEIFDDHISNTEMQMRLQEARI